MKTLQYSHTFLYISSTQIDTPLVWDSCGHPTFDTFLASSVFKQLNIPVSLCIYQGIAAVFDICGCRFVFLYFKLSF